MGAGRRGTGVELRPASIRVSFTWNGRCRETLEIKPTEAHRKYAERLVDTINRRIAAGTFVYAEFFPDSPRAAPAAQAETFAIYAARFLKAMTPPRVAAATADQYERQLKFWGAQELDRSQLADAKMVDVRHSELAALVGAIEWPSAKRRNNVLIPLRGVFDLWVADDRRGRTSPMLGVENAKWQKPKPDPFSRAEAEFILADMGKHYDERVVAYYELAFFSGLRPEEEIAFRWPKYDARRRMGRIETARTFAGTEKDLKNSVARDVEFVSRAVAAIERMKKWTVLKPHGHVLENPRTGKPWASEADQRDLYWTPTLRRLKLRHRPAYATRATFATMCLMAGMNPAKVAKMMGHSKRVFWETYADWIDEADRGREMKKLEDELARPLDEDFVPAVSPGR